MLPLPRAAPPRRSRWDGVVVALGPLPPSVAAAAASAAASRGAGYATLTPDALVGGAGARGAARAARIHALVAAGIADGVVTPLPAAVRASTDLVDALADAADAGASVVVVAEEGKGGAAAPPPLVTPTFVADPADTYLVTGGVGGFGMELAAWLADAGATCLVLSSRRGLRTGEQAAVVAALRARGVDVIVSTKDVGTAAGAAALVDESHTPAAPLVGVFHLAMVLDDRMLPNHDGASWVKCVKPKAAGAWHLDAALRASGAPVRHFVMWSSIVAHEGGPGQSNYAFSNNALDSLARSRAARGEPALAIQWGRIGDVGVVVEHLSGDNEVQLRMMSSILAPMPIVDCLAVLGEVMADRATPPPPPVVQLRALNALRRGADGGDAAGGASGAGSLVAAVLDVLGAADGSVPEHETLGAMGVDSIQSVEVRSRVQRALGRPFPLDEVAGLTVAKLRELK